MYYINKIITQDSSQSPLATQVVYTIFQNKISGLLNELGQLHHLKPHIKGIKTDEALAVKWITPKQIITQRVQPRLMNILPYKLKTTKEQLSSRAGLMIVAQVIKKLELSQNIDRHFPKPKSNRGIITSSYIETLMLIQHEGYFRSDKALSQILCHHPTY